MACSVNANLYTKYDAYFFDALSGIVNKADSVSSNRTRVPRYGRTLRAFTSRPRNLLATLTLPAGRPASATRIVWEYPVWDTSTQRDMQREQILLNLVMQ